MQTAQDQIRLRHQFARRLAPVGLVIGILLSLGAPVTYYVVEFRSLRSDATAYARQVAQRLPGDDDDLIQRLFQEKSVLAIRVHDAAGRPVAHYESPTRTSKHFWDAFAPHGAHPARFGSVEVRVSQDRLVTVTAVLLLLSTAVGVSLALVVYLSPISVAAKMEDHVRGLIAERETLVEIERELVAETDRDRLLRLIVERASLLFRANGSIYLIERESTLVPREWTEQGAFSDVRIPVGEGFVGTCAQRRHALIVNDYPTSPFALPKFVAVGLKRAIAQPLIFHDQLLGVIAMNRIGDESSPFAQEDVNRLASFAAPAAIALENAKLFEENRRRVEELAVLHELSRAVTGQLDRPTLIDAIHTQIARVFDARNMLIALGGEHDKALEVALSVRDGTREPDPAMADLSHALGLASMVLANGRSVRGGEYLADRGPQGPQADAIAKIRDWLGVPMRAGDAVLGVLMLHSGERPFTAAAERLLTNVAHLGALALRSARLFEERARAHAELASAQDQLVRGERLRALGEMASGVAHDFNNLLAAILGRAELLLRRVDDPKLRTWLETIVRSANDGAQTVRRLQEFTRIRRDQPFVAVDLNKVLQEALEVTESRWRQEPQSRGITIDVRTELRPLPPVAGDPAELRQAMINIILNALDAMPRGGALALTTAVDGQEVEITISDTGVGMPESIRQKIFDPFFTTKGPQGTGLGLSVTFGILSRHGARIAVESEQGRGSCFRLVFPRSGDSKRPEATIAEPPTVAPLRCLVVDDEEDVGEVLGDMLEMHGHRAVVLKDGAEAVTRFRAEPFDVVFTDLAMAGLSGWQVADAVKGAAPEVPVVLVTGFADELSAAERQAHALAAVLVKPIKMNELLTIVAHVAQTRAAGVLERRDSRPTSP